MLDTLRQDGCLKARFPRRAADEWPGATTLNCAGGVAGGDEIDTRIEAAAHTSATIASQAAERIYRALPGATSRIRTTLVLAPHARLEWLPQETILFDRCALDRRLDIELDETSQLLMVETLVFGRAAMGEQVETARLRDRITLRRGGRLVLHDAIRLDGPVAPLLRRPAVGGDARATGTILLASPDGERHLVPLRDALADVDAGATWFDGMLLARIACPGGLALRAAVTRALNILRNGRTLPRTWLC